MKNKRFTAKILIDIGMTICLLLLMPYSLLSETAHEWIGMAMLVLFISHHILNYKWVTSVRKGKYNAFRVIHSTGYHHAYSYNGFHDKWNIIVKSHI